MPSGHRFFFFISYLFTPVTFGLLRHGSNLSNSWLLVGCTLAAGPRYKADAPSGIFELDSLNYWYIWQKGR